MALEQSFSEGIKTIKDWATYAPKLPQTDSPEYRVAQANLASSRPQLLELPKREANEYALNAADCDAITNYGRSLWTVVASRLATEQFPSHPTIFDKLESAVGEDKIFASEFKSSKDGRYYKVEYDHDQSRQVVTGISKFFNRGKLYQTVAKVKKDGTIRITETIKSSIVPSLIANLLSRTTRHTIKAGGGLAAYARSQLHPNTLAALERVNNIFETYLSR